MMSRDHLRVARRLVAAQRDDLGDVHALIAHPLDRLHDVEQSGDQPQVGRDRLLGGEQRQDRLVDLEVATVDPIVVGDHHLGELDVGVLDRLERPRQRLDDEIEATERPLLELGELL